VSDKLTEMWTAFEAHEPDASYADEWATMCRERTQEAARAAFWAAPEESAAAWAAGWARWAVDAAKADRYAQDAIDALKREVKP
jgi:hypothetical protein